jgi:hypothetical protein
VVVPTREATAAEQNEAGPSEPFLFEQNDFEDLFTPGAAAAPAVQISPQRGANGAGAVHQQVAVVPHAAEAPVGAWGTHAEPAFDVERIDVTPTPPAGIVLSPTKATVLSVVWIVTLVAAFGAGLLVGLLMRPEPQPREEEQAAAVRPGERPA